MGVFYQLRNHLCAVAGYGPTALTARFRHVTGLSPARFVAREQLRQVQKRLIHTTDSLSTIAADLGFVDAFHLSRRFKAAFGEPPGSYRQQNSVVKEE